jgi:hypothetical protein
MFHKFKLVIPFLVIGIRKQGRPQECRQRWKENVGAAIVRDYRDAASFAKATARRGGRSHIEIMPQGGSVHDGLLSLKR